MKNLGRLGKIQRIVAQQLEHGPWVMESVLFRAKDRVAGNINQPDTVSSPGLTPTALLEDLRRLQEEVRWALKSGDLFRVKTAVKILEMVTEMAETDFPGISALL